MERERVSVRPGMKPATMMVAPNSPMERAKASRMPAMMPRLARGRVIFRNTWNRLPPRERAAASRWAGTSSKAVRRERTRRGKAMTARARTTAFQVKMTSMPKVESHEPMNPVFPKSLRRMRPVATGGMTRGSMARVSARVLPGHSLRARSHARAVAKGIASRTARDASAKVRASICQSEGVTCCFYTSAGKWAMTEACGGG